MYLHIITLIVYGLLGLQYDASSVDSEVVTMMTAAIQENFHMNILLLLPAVAVIVMAICKCPSIPTLMVSTLVAVVLAMLVQGQTLSGILNILDSGFSIDTALPEFNRLVNRGGLQSMLWTAALGILGMLYGSIMEKTGLLEALLSKMDPLVKSTGGLVTAVVLTCTLLLMATAPTMATTRTRSSMRCATRPLPPSPSQTPTSCTSRHRKCCSTTCRPFRCTTPMPMVWPRPVFPASR